MYNIKSPSKIIKLNTKPRPKLKNFFMTESGVIKSEDLANLEKFKPNRFNNITIVHGEGILIELQKISKKEIHFL